MLRQINSDWYLTTYPSVADELVKFCLKYPFQHYLRIGEQRRYAPVPRSMRLGTVRPIPTLRRPSPRGCFSAPIIITPCMARARGGSRVR